MQAEQGPPRMCHARNRPCLESTLLRLQRVGLTRSSASVLPLPGRMWYAPRALSSAGSCSEEPTQFSVRPAGRGRSTGAEVWGCTRRFGSRCMLGAEAFFSGNQSAFRPRQCSAVPPSGSAPHRQRCAASWRRLPVPSRSLQRSCRSPFEPGLPCRRSCARRSRGRKVAWDGIQVSGRCQCAGTRRRTAACPSVSCFLFRGNASARAAAAPPQHSLEPEGAGQLRLLHRSAHAGRAGRGAAGRRGVGRRERPAGRVAAGLFFRVATDVAASSRVQRGVHARMSLLCSMQSNAMAAAHKERRTHVMGASTTNTAPPEQLRKGPAVTLATEPSSDSSWTVCTVCRAGKGGKGVSAAVSSDRRY